MAAENGWGAFFRFPFLLIKHKYPHSYLGVTPPISTDESTPKEKEVTVTLMEELRRQNTFESEEESRTR